MALNAGQSQRFNYTGAIQSITLKPGVYKVECAGARGGNSGTNGSFISGKISLSKTSTLQIYCGGTPSGQSGGWGYANGSSGQSGGGKYAWGGGGGTQVYLDSSNYIRAVGGKGSDNSYTTQSTTTGITGYKWTHLSSNDDGGTSLNFKLTYTVTKGTTYGIGVTSYGSDRTGSCVASATWPGGSFSNETISFYSKTTYNIHRTFTPTSNGTLTFWSTSYTVDPVANISRRDPVYGDITTTTTHPLTGGAGGGTTSIVGFMIDTMSSYSNTGNGYVIVTCLDLYSLTINCINCKVNGNASYEIFDPMTVSITALHAMLINNVPSIFDEIIIPNGLLPYLNIVHDKHKQITADEPLIARDLTFTIEAIYHENERRNDNYYKNVTNPIASFVNLLVED